MCTHRHRLEWHLRFTTMADAREGQEDQEEGVGQLSNVEDDVEVQDTDALNEITRYVLAMYTPRVGQHIGERTARAVRILMRNARRALRRHRIRVRQRQQADAIDRAVDVDAAVGVSTGADAAVGVNAGADVAVGETADAPDAIAGADVTVGKTADTPDAIGGADGATTGVQEAIAGAGVAVGEIDEDASGASAAKPVQKA